MCGYSLISEDGYLLELAEPHHHYAARRKLVATLLAKVHEFQPENVVYHRNQNYFGGKRNAAPNQY